MGQPQTVLQTAPVPGARLSQGTRWVAPPGLVQQFPHAFKTESQESKEQKQADRQAQKEAAEKRSQDIEAGKQLARESLKTQRSKAKIDLDITMKQLGDLEKRKAELMATIKRLDEALAK